MKKIYGIGRWQTFPRRLSQFLRIMKLTMILLTVFSLGISAKSFSQTITYTGKNVSIKKVFSAIQQQTGYSFFYNTNVVDQSANVTVSYKRAKLKDVLNRLLIKRDFGYDIQGKTVFIYEKIQPDINMQMEQIKQANPIHGTVLDSATGEPIVGATVRIKGKSKGTVTVADGKFELEVEDDAVLEVSYLGYGTKVVAVDGKESLTVSLSEAATGLDQLVVVGYGTQKKENLTGAISTVDMTTKQGQPITNVSNALYGTPGLYVNLINSQPGVDRAQIRVRGIGNLKGAGSAPLVLVDGIEYPLNEINPNDIASISVLKDASAAIYGSKAANGVILVTTKKGKGKVKVNYNYYYGIQQPTFMPDVIWDPIEYMKLFNQAERNEGKQKMTFSDQQIHEYEVGMHLDPFTYPANNWFDKVLRNGNIQKHDLSVSKSTESYSYRASLGFLKRDGIFIGNGNKEKKYYYGLNTSLKVSERLKIGFNINGNYRKYTQPSTSMGTFLNAIHRALPIMPDTLGDGKWAYTWLRVPGRNNWENPLMYLENDGFYEKTQLWTLASVNADYKLPFGITYKVKFGVDKYDAFQKRFYPRMVKYQVKTNVEMVHSSSAPHAFNYDWNNIQLHFYNTLDWNKNFDQGHNVSVMVGASYDNYGNSSFNAQMRGYSDNVLTALSVGNDPYSITGSSSEDVLESYFGRLNYDYKGKYLIQGIFRFDGSSRFAPGHRWGFFPGVSAGWRIDKESFFTGANFVDMLKLRASVGQSGSQAVSLYSYENDVTLGHDYSFGGTNGILFPGAASTSLADPTTSWETTINYDVGLDVALWKNRLSLTVDLYERWTKGILRTINIPDQVGGLSGPKTNVGTISNKGYEISLKYRNHIGKFNYSVYGNVSYNKNNVEGLGGEIIYNNSNGGLSTITKEGSSVSSFFLREVEGIFQSDAEVAKHATQSGNTKAGYLKYKDVNEDGMINDDDRVNTRISAVLPDYNYGFGFSVGYEGIKLSAHFQGVGGYYVMPGANLAYPFNNGAGVTWKWATDSWTPERPNASLPIVTEANYGDKENFKPSTFWLKNASYLRLKSIQLEYKIPEMLLNKVKIKALNVFVNAENWLTFTQFKEADPEGIYNAGSLYHYPMLKTINAGINITF